MRKLAIAVTAIASMIGLSISVAPAQAAGAKPVIESLSYRTPDIRGGQYIQIGGQNLNTVTQVLVDSNPASIVNQTSNTLMFVTPSHDEAYATLTLFSPSGQVSQIDAFSYRPGSRRALAPVPYIPETFKVGKTYKLLPFENTLAVVAKSFTPKICTVSGLTLKAIKKGSCNLSVAVNIKGANAKFRSTVTELGVTVN